MDRTLLIEKIRNVTDRQKLLDLLNEVKADLHSPSYPFTMRKMMKLCNPRDKKIKRRYHLFSIAKKSGGFREIYAPCGNLKWMQKCLNVIFKAIYTPSIHATGFTQGRNIVDNARIHINQNYVFNIDLSDFFPSIDQARVWKRLQLAPFNFNKEVANVIAGLCCIKSIRSTAEKAFSECYNLPQGAPTSPLITNAICDKLDRRLAGLAKRFGLRYSRYADDITFSSMRNVYQENSEFRKELQRIITDQHFVINPKKTRLHHRGQRQEVTGLTVGEKINVPRKYVKDIRAILHIWEKYGQKAAYSAFYPQYKAEKGHIHSNNPDLVRFISGKLCYLKLVKGEYDPVYIKLSAQFAKLKVTAQSATSNERKWEYLMTETIPHFEKRLGVKINFAKSKGGKDYAYFELNGTKIMIALSQNLSANNLPDDIKISFCVRTDFKLRFQGLLSINEKELKCLDQTTPFGRMKLDMPLPEDLGKRYYYLIHNPLKDNCPRRFVIKDPNAEKFKDKIRELAKSTPKLGLEDNLGIIVPACDTEKDTLTRLVESGFDLSILP